MITTENFPVQRLPSLSLDVFYDDDVLFESSLRVCVAVDDTGKREES